MVPQTSPSHLIQTSAEGSQRSASDFLNPIRMQTQTTPCVLEARNALSHHGKSVETFPT